MKNFKGNYTKGSVKNKKCKICPSITWELECAKYPKTFCKICGRQNIQNQTNAKDFSNPEDILKSDKNFLEKLKPKYDSSKTTTSKVLSKIPHKKKTSKQQYHF